MSNITLVIILPTYCESQSLAELLDSLLNEFVTEAKFVVVDDSPDRISAITAENVFEQYGFKNYEILTSLTKNGRGHAVHRGLQYVHKNHPTVPAIEMDSDGSHLASDVRVLYQHLLGENFGIGSRYGTGSRISGWPISRRVFSRLLN